jgi:transglutaminase-like putative cysteine protease
MKIVKYRCTKCGFSEELTLKDRIGKVIHDSFASLGIVFVFVLVLSYVVGNSFFLTDVVTLRMNKAYTDFAKENDDGLREIALNLTSICDGGDSYCYAANLYYNLDNLKYIPNSKYKVLYHPLYVYENGGDCKNTASLVVALMGSLGFDSEVRCNIQKEHCVAYIDRDDFEYIIVDLAQNKFEMYNKSYDFWKDY